VPSGRHPFIRVGAGAGNRVPARRMFLASPTGFEPVLPP